MADAITTEDIIGLKRHVAKLRLQEAREDETGQGVPAYYAALARASACYGGRPLGHAHGLDAQTRFEYRTASGREERAVRLRGGW